MAHQVQHNLAHQHILEHPQSAFSIHLRTQNHECLEEIQVCGVVYIFHVEDGLGIELGVEVRGAVY